MTKNEAAVFGYLSTQISKLNKDQNFGIEYEIDEHDQMVIWLVNRDGEVA